MNGFGPDQVSAQRIARIPLKVQKAYEKTNAFKENGWPFYVFGKELFEGIGAEFRTIDDTEEMLIDDVVYEVEDYRACYISVSRYIGVKAIEELNKQIDLEELPFEEDDIWHEPEIHIVTGLGMLLIRCQEIEDYIARSFILGLSPKQKKKHKTLGELTNAWKKKTLGNLIKSIEEAWVIEPNFKENLDQFVKNRNQLIHGITVDERFDIRTNWGQRELLVFLTMFDTYSRIIKSVFRGAYYASFELGRTQWESNRDLLEEVDFPKNMDDEIQLFLMLFSPKKQ
ncbi:hypothetical protein [Kordiimonas aquimaris]|uniref:hypothetical protein n=1 Tax=Kordiimonas aquimaris TaxID=707591 RepID=UPI0021D2D49B|nr:hypothetical protein [Kordiimonas aquimaris]